MILQWMFGKKSAGAEQPKTLAQAIEIATRNPLDPVANCSLGKIYLDLNLVEEAKACFEEASRLKPDYAEAHYKLGNALRLQGQLDEALACYQRAISLSPDYAEAHSNEGVVHEERGDRSGAIASHRKALSIDPGIAYAHFNLGRLLAAQGDSAEALACFHKAIALAPDLTEAHIAEGLLHKENHQWNAATVSYQRALSVDPGCAEAYNCLGVAFRLQDKLGDAIDSFRKAISLSPDFAAAHSQLGSALAQMGRNVEAVAAHRRALSLSLESVVGQSNLLHSNLLFHLSHDPGVTAEEMIAAHRGFAERFEAPFRSRWPQHRNLPDPARKLRVGFVSGDLRVHAVSSFIEPLWAAFDAKQVELWAYSNHRLEDEVTQRLKGLAHQWRKVVDMSDEDLADRIRQDGIDILFDMSGHSAGHRLLAFARKPAPIQVSWIGNPNTTGLQAMDYYLADRFSAPPGLLDALFTEKIVRLPAWASFRPQDESPAVNELPVLKSGMLTFGSFNRSDKLAHEVVALWCRVLNAVPGSRMLLGSSSDASRKDYLVAQFARNGVDEKRVIFHPRASMTEYLALHHQVDLILDTFPFSGFTVSCHAAWMGVPVLTLAGKTLSSRLGVSIDSSIGLPEFIAESEDAFVATAVRWSRRLPELAALRASLRSRVLASPLCQTQAFARSLELALRIMWQRWCEKKPPESFGIDPAEYTSSVLHPRGRSPAIPLQKNNPTPQEMETLAALFTEGRYTEAATIARTMTVRFPRHGFGWKVLGLVFIQMGQRADALASMQKAAALSPNDPETHSNLGNFLQEQGRLFEAEASCRRALQISPDLAEAHNNLGNTLKDLGRLDEAETSYRRALQIKPEFVEAHSNLGVTFKDLGRLVEAEASYRRALEIKPDYAEAHYNLGNTLRDLGRLVEAEASCRRALQLKPDFAVFHSNLLFCLSHASGITPEEVFAEHRAFGERFETPFRGRWPEHRNLPDPGRALRVGFVSGDLRVHAVSSFIEPLWAAFDAKQVEIWAYSNHRLEDEVTLRLKGFAHRWRNVAVMSDEELAVQVREDEIDILFDLSGHTAGHRLLTFARKPAPIQVSWIGNPNTTGLKAMDYYLADRFSAPPGLLDAQFTEKIVRLPSGALFQPLDPAPAVNGLPALESGVLTFGSFSRGDKLTEGVVALWSRVLNATPGSRMLLGSLSDASWKDNLAGQFARHGVDRGRLVFHPRAGMTEYLALHHQVDLILDTFPFGGGTTSCHAAWMGVPVLTLAGKTMSSRVGLIINSNLGLPEFVTESEDAFVAQAVRLSQRLPELAALRARLRSQALSSPLCQTQAAARSLELALRIMWQRWCEKKPTESFGIDP